MLFVIISSHFSPSYVAVLPFLNDETLSIICMKHLLANQFIVFHTTENVCYAFVENKLNTYITREYHVSNVNTDVYLSLPGTRLFPRI